MVDVLPKMFVYMKIHLYCWNKNKDEISGEFKNGKIKTKNYFCYKWFEIFRNKVKL